MLRLVKTPNIGIFVMSTDEVALVPDTLKDRDIKHVQEVLDVNVIQTRIGGSSLVGVFTVGVGKKIVVPWIIKEEEVRALEKEGLEVLILKDRVTALGNLIALNSKGGIVSRSVSERAKKILEEFLNIPLLHTNLSDIEVVGASIVATDKGFIAHPSLEKEENNIEKALKVRGTFITVNKGDPFVRNGIVANRKGALVGGETTPVELMKIEDVLG